MSNVCAVVLFLALALLPALAAVDEMLGPLTRETLFETHPEWQAAEEDLVRILGL